MYNFNFLRMKNKLLMSILLIGMTVISCSDEMIEKSAPSENSDLISEVQSLRVTNDFLKSLNKTTSTRSLISADLYPNYYGGYYIGLNRKPVFMVVKGLETMAQTDIEKRTNSNYFSIEPCTYSYNQLNSVRMELRKKFADETLESLIEQLGWVGHYIDQQDNCIYVLLQSCLDSDVAAFKEKVNDSPLIRFKEGEMIVLPSAKESLQKSRAVGVTELGAGGFINNQGYGDGSAGYRAKYYGSEGFVTAGHVAYAAGREIGFVSGGPRIGMCEYSIMGGSNMVDAAFISFYSPYRMTTSTAYKKTPLSDDIVLLGVNDYVQKEGGTTFWSAGTVTQVGVDMRFTSPDGKIQYNVKNLTVATYNSDSGDSGGIVYSQYLGQIAGIHIAGNKADKHYYLPADDVNAALGTEMY